MGFLPFYAVLALLLLPLNLVLLVLAALELLLGGVTVVFGDAGGRGEDLVTHGVADLLPVAQDVPGLVQQPGQQVDPEVDDGLLLQEAWF